MPAKNNKLADVEYGPVGNGDSIALNTPKEGPTPPMSPGTVSINLTGTASDSDSTSLLKHVPFNGISLMHGHTDISTVTSVDSSKFRNRMNGKFGRVRKRVVFKNGDCNLHQTNISKRKRRYLADIFTTLVDIQWRWTLLLFMMSFLLSWLAFAMIWWLISFTHGDLEPDHLPDKQEKSSWEPCIGNFYGFTSAFLFSIETQHTIGYGFRYTTEECPEAIIVMCIQSILGVMIKALMVGVVFAKMSRPKKRTQTLMFSRHAVICQRDGDLTLMFRVGDMRKSHIICASVRAQLIRRRQTVEGEHLPFYQHELKVGVDSDQQSIFFIWPMIITHKIDNESPLYGISAADLIREKFEIVLILEGVVESTGSTTQARSSYLPAEILWGHRFEPLVNFKKELGQYDVDYRLFNHTYEVDTPLCSARDLDELRQIQNEIKRQGMNNNNNNNTSSSSRQFQYALMQSPSSPSTSHSQPTSSSILNNVFNKADSNSSKVSSPIPDGISNIKRAQILKAMQTGDIWLHRDVAAAESTTTTTRNGNSTSGAGRSSPSLATKSLDNKFSELSNNNNNNEENEISNEKVAQQFTQQQLSTITTAHGVDSIQQR